MLPLKIVCVSANPAVDRRVYVHTLLPGQVNRAHSSLAMPGGKAAHVAMAATALELRANWIGFLGGTIGEEVAMELSKLSIAVSTVPAKFATRVNLEVIEDSGRITEVLESGGQISRDEHDDFLRRYNENLNGEWRRALVSISGSVPPGLPLDFYPQLIQLAKNAGSEVFLDASGSALESAIAAKPDFVKPNRKEAELLLGRTFRDSQAVLDAAREICSLGAGSVAITLGAEGLLWLERKDGPAWFAQPPPLKAISTVGCGDTTLAGFAYAALTGLAGEEAVRFATACGAANCLVKLEGRILLSDVRALIPQVTVKRLL